ncbi:MAG: hypothetical protein R8K47_00115, partial [Mariprofundaceae bacterium]
MRRAAALAALLVLVPQPAPAVGARADVRLQELLTRAPDSLGREGWSSLTRLRMMGDLDGRSGGMDWRLHLAWDFEGLWGQAARDTVQRALFVAPLPTRLDADTVVRRRGALLLRHSLYRGWLRIERGP